MERIIRQVEFPAEAPKLIRVVAYARVSSGKEAMLQSLSAQISYYSDLIQKHPGWQYCGVYADEAMTGTKDDRENFQRLLEDCRSGKIDMVITKSISRFARNTVTLLETVRELKLLGVNVYFEEQNIFTLSADGELMMTILASYAQEESRSVSENQKWRVRANFKEGLPWNGTLLGYRIQNGVYVPDEEEAALVRLIFAFYNDGWGANKIANYLNKNGYRTRKGNEWRQNTVQKILNNYSYTGNLLLQTTFIEDHITKKGRLNEGQLPMYHAQNSHEPIITMEEFQTTQCTRQVRAATYRHEADRSIKYPFRGKLLCTDCGKNYRRKVARSGPIWICSTYNTKGKAFCPTSKAIPEDKLLEETAKVLGQEVFEEDSFRELVDHIEVSSGNRLDYYFKDGSSVFTIWQDRSRAESWTEEMREIARQSTLRKKRQEREINEEAERKDNGCLFSCSYQISTSNNER